MTRPAKMVASLETVSLLGAKGVGVGPDHLLEATGQGAARIAIHVHVQQGDGQLVRIRSDWIELRVEK